MKVNEIGFVAIPVTDIPRAREFYEGALRLEQAAQFMDGKWIEYGFGSDTLAIANISDTWTPSDQGTGVALEVEDFEAAIAHLKAKGVKFAWDAFESPVCHMAIVQDPDGNKIIIHKRKASTC